MSDRAAASRRLFLKYLAGSPLVTAAALKAVAAENPMPVTKLPDPLAWAPMQADQLIKSPKDAINVFDFEPVCRNNVPPAHFGYMAAGIDDEVTLRANREGFLKLQLRPRRMLNDVSVIDQSIEIFGQKWASPVFICPTGSNRMFNPEGEIAVAKAAGAAKHLQILSTQASSSIDDAIKARGGPIWFQLYASPSWDIALGLVKRAENAGSPALAITVDRVAGRNQETLFRLQRQDPRHCADCHDNSSPAATVRDKPNFAGIDVAATGVKNLQSANMTWDFIRRMRDATKMKILVKGILTPEDAKLCVENGVDGFIVSNHGGRAEDSGLATIEALPDIIAATQGKIPVLVDSGFRRGTDVLKALALGATAVGIGRPYLWGLGAFGQDGVDKVLEIMRTETAAAMGQCGVNAVKQLSPNFVKHV